MHILVHAFLPISISLGLSIFVSGALCNWEQCSQRNEAYVKFQHMQGIQIHLAVLQKSSLFPVTPEQIS
jgi:hypothetical protein